MHSQIRRITQQSCTVLGTQSLERSLNRYRYRQSSGRNGNGTGAHQIGTGTKFRFSIRTVTFRNSHGKTSRFRKGIMLFPDEPSGKGLNGLRSVVISACPQAVSKRMYTKAQHSSRTDHRNTGILRRINTYKQTARFRLAAA